MAAADVARDNGDWTAAVAHYQQYLRTRPGHFSIWVQLGHALKEAGRCVDALFAYNRALALNGKDSDLLLNLGHLYKRMSCRKIAIEYYRLSILADSNAYAYTELKGLGMSMQQIDTILSSAARKRLFYTNVRIMINIFMPRAVYNIIHLFATWWIYSIIGRDKPAYRDYIAIRDSGLFDGAFYMEEGHCIDGACIDPIWHYCIRGWREGRRPNRNFNPRYYLETSADVLEAQLNPFAHWITVGQSERRNENFRTTIREGLRNSNSPSVIFICHEASKTGAPMVLLAFLKWLSRNTTTSYSIVVGVDGPLGVEFEALAPCFYMNRCPKDQVELALAEFCGGRVQLVYINTIASGIYAHELRFLNAEFIAHVHEMEGLFRSFEHSFELIANLCSRYIAVSEGAEHALKTRLEGRLYEIIRVPPFIEAWSCSEAHTSDMRGDPKRIIYGCGWIEPRKGPDLFCEVAEELLRLGRNDFKLCWIGNAGNFDFDAEISRRNLDGYVEWLGPKSDPRIYFQDGFAFILPSREDPFPLVCLEAAAACLPIVCFDERAGGIYSFVEDDAGIVVPYLDAEAMAAAVDRLLRNQKWTHNLGLRAREKVRLNYVVDAVAPQIYAMFPKIRRC